MKLQEIIRIIEAEYPPKLMYEWDNAGLFYGDTQREISRITLTLDVTPEVIAQAVANKSQMILSHHPVIMGGVKTLSDNSMTSKMICEIVKNDICVYSAHTNMDTARNGINQKLAERFELENVCVMTNDKEDEGCGLGRVGDLKTVMQLEDFCELVKEKLGTPFVRVCGGERLIKRVAFASGGCSEFVPDAILRGADVIVTADMKYHNCIEYVYDGIAIIDAGHYPTEIIVRDMFSRLLSDYDVEVVYADSRDIFNMI